MGLCQYGSSSSQTIHHGISVKLIDAFYSDGRNVEGTVMVESNEFLARKAEITHNFHTND